MSQTRTEKDPQGLASLLKSGRGDTVSYRQLFETLGKTIPFAEGFVVTSLPRGGLQIVQPAKVPEALLKGYGKEFHAEDRATWYALQSQRPVRGAEAFGKGEESGRYVKEFMQPAGLRYLAVAPLSAPVLEGYPGAIHLYRTD